MKISYEKYVWETLVQLMREFSTVDNTFLFLSTSKIKDIYPHDEENKFGNLLMLLVKNVNKEFNLQIKVDYLPYQEHEKFQTLQDVWVYFISKKGEAKL